MKVKIQNNSFLKGRYYLLELSVPFLFKEAAPGQFLHIRVEDSCDPLLRRPLSVHDSCFLRAGKTGTVKILYGVVGKGTELLSGKKSGNVIDCLGPFGTGFDLGKIVAFKNIFIVAGGIGVAPLFFLAKQITAHLRTGQKIIVLIGAKTKEDILREKEFKSLGCRVYAATEDGSRGFKGRVTELLKNFLPLPANHGLATICACGPKPMLAAAAEIARKHEISAQVSLEEFMGCGIGACLGCVIKTRSGYKRICHDGPVFDAQEIEWKE